MHKARTALRQIAGNEIPVVPHESGKHLVAKIGLDTEALMAFGASEISVVAGARYAISRTSRSSVITQSSRGIGTNRG